MRCDICNYKTDRREHFIRHESSNKHYKNRYKYLKKQKEINEAKCKNLDNIIKHNLDDEGFVYVSKTVKEDPKLKTKFEIVRLINEMLDFFMMNDVDLHKEIANYNYYRNNYKKLTVIELNDLYDELENLKTNFKIDFGLN